MAYVAEGSQLGGAVLYQRLASQLAPQPLAYLGGDTAGPGPRWRTVEHVVPAKARTCTEEDQ